MARNGGIDLRGLETLRQNLKETEQSIDKFIESCAKNLASRLLAKVIKRTPVGIYDEPVSFVTKDGKEVNFTPKTGIKGGTLRSGWTSSTQREAEINSAFEGGLGVQKYVEELEVRKVGDTFQIEIINPVEYASYVESGHRTPNGKGWVRGKYMLKISEQEIQSAAPAILERRIKQKLSEAFQ